MRVDLLRIVCAAILGLCVGIASANVAQAAAGLEHSCCSRSAPADSLTAPEAPCNGFLPLTCCHAAALPGGDHESTPAPAATAPITAGAPIQTMAPAVIARGELAALAPRIAAARLTVVRQL
jgi:hypothetical protein